MASTIPGSHRIPATPPPEHDTFLKSMFPPQLPKIPGAGPCPAPDTTAPGQAQPQPQSQTRIPIPPTVGSTTSGSVPLVHDPAGNPIDPRYLAMVSRISAYYQQRCQAVANYQQQRCQAWANMQRQKCQQMMQSAMLVVAWYVRDKIRRRRRRQKRQFGRCLSRKCAGQKVAKRESTRRWVLGVPSDVLPASDAGREKLADQEEAEFTMDKERTPDSDTKLYNVAENIIKSQITKVDVPLMGVLSFDESESETEEENEDEYEQDEDMGDSEGDGQYDNPSYENEGVGQEEEAHDNMGSQEVQISTGERSRKRRRCSLGR